MSESVRVMVLGKVTLQLAPLGHGNGLCAYPGGGIRVADPPVTAVPVLDTAAYGATPGQYSLGLEALVVQQTLTPSLVVLAGTVSTPAQRASIAPRHRGRVA